MATEAVTTPQTTDAARPRTRKAPAGRPKTQWWMWLALLALLVFCLFPFY